MDEVEKRGMSRLPPTRTTEVESAEDEAKKKIYTSQLPTIYTPTIYTATIFWASATRPQATASTNSANPRFVEGSAIEDGGEIEAVAGFRTWRLDESSRLTSFGGAVWEPGEELEARCDVHALRCHTADPARYHRHGNVPDENCGCGIYAFSEWGRLKEYAHLGDYDNAGDFIRARLGLVPGIVSAGGEAILHETGFRTQRARVEAIIQPVLEVEPAIGTPKPILEEIKAGQSKLQTVADLYGVPLISPDEVQAFCWAEGFEILDPEREAEDSAMQIARKQFQDLAKKYPWNPILGIPGGIIPDEGGRG